MTHPFDRAESADFPKRQFVLSVGRITVLVILTETLFDALERCKFFLMPLENLAIVLKKEYAENPIPE